MAPLATVQGTQILVQIGDGGTPTEVFTHDCLINAARGIEFTTETNEVLVPDCTNPDDPAWRQVFKTGISASISGAGKLHSQTAKTLWYDWLVSKDPKNVRLNIAVPLAAGGGYFQGQFHLTQFNISSEARDLAEADVSLVSTGALTWTDAAA